MGNPPFKVVIAGSRNFKDYALLQQKMSNYLQRKLPNVQVISGTAKGADKLGERFAGKHGLPLKKYPADWDKYGKRAGYIRNKQMAELADAVVVFWDGKSRGSKLMIDIANNLGKPLRIVRFVPNQSLSFVKSGA